MKATTRRTAVVLAASALGVAALSVAVPALAGANPFSRPSPAVSAVDRGPGWGDGNAMGAGPRSDFAAGMMARDGGCLGPGITAAPGTLTQAQQSTLAAQAQEEKLAHDLYAAFSGAHQLAIFDRIAAAERQHLTAVRTLLDRYGLADPTAEMPAGAFSDPAVQARYDRLLAEGQASQAAALVVGTEVEESTIAGLTAALDGLAAADVRQVYTNLLAASQHHLAAYERWVS